jgi:hypothetical protein
LGQYASIKNRIHSQSRRATDLPKDVSSLSAVLQDHLTPGGRGQRTGDLEDKHAIRIALAIQPENAGYAQ